MNSTKENRKQINISSSTQQKVALIFRKHYGFLQKLANRSSNCHNHLKDNPLVSSLFLEDYNTEQHQVIYESTCYVYNEFLGLCDYYDIEEGKYNPNNYIKTTITTIGIFQFNSFQNNRSFIPWDEIDVYKFNFEYLTGNANNTFTKQWKQVFREIIGETKSMQLKNVLLQKDSKDIEDSSVQETHTITSDEEDKASFTEECIINESPISEYKNIAYLLGCYTIIADKEINEFELCVLDDYMQIEKESKLYAERQRIFSDDEDKITLDKLLSALKKVKLSESQKADIIRLIAKTGYSDGHLAIQEKELIEKVAKSIHYDAQPIINEESANAQRVIQSNKLKWHQSLWGRFESFTYNISSNKNDAKTDKLLKGLGFGRAIEDITEEAIVDLDRVSRIMNDINSKLKDKSIKVSQTIPESQKQDKEVQDIISALKTLSANFEDIINNSLSENIDLLDKKERNIRYFTIAFMGRTKAGKSTLHKVVTQQENDDIGVGKLRTTRYNRSWYWDKLRIVDTPGIGAPGGDTDTNIAKSIIDEADMICYVVTSDAIQETEFDFFETIKERNKPLYIILNYKSNISEGVRLKKFLNNPLEWKDCDGPKSIKGHFDRIKERLEGKYNMDAVEIIPLHLLAAVLSFEKEDDTETAKKLLLGSNIETFIRSVKKEIYETGCLKKSLSIIDGCSYHINKIHEKISIDYLNLKERNEVLKEKRKQLDKFLESEAIRLQWDLDRIINNTIKEFKNRASAFAEEQYDNKNAGTYWQKDIVVKNIYNNLNKRINVRIEDFCSKLKSKFEELAYDMQHLNCFNNKINVSGESIVNSRLGAGIVGSVISVIAPIVIANIWNPGGWAMAGITVAIGLVVTFFTSLFKSKSEKIKEAISDMKFQLYKNIDDNMEQTRKAIMNNVQSSIEKTEMHIENTFGSYIIGVDSILSEINNLLIDCKNDEASINSLISFRILNYLGKSKVKDRKIKDLTNADLRLQYPVERNWENQSFTFKYTTGCSDKDKEKAEKATQMIINF